MKKYILLISIMLAIVLDMNAQQKRTRSTGSFTEVDARLEASKNLIIPKGEEASLNGGLNESGQLYYNVTTQKLMIYNGTVWENVSSSSTIPGGAITSIPTLGFNPGTDLTPDNWIKNTFYQSQPPTSSLSGGFTYELSVTGVNHLLNWSYGRQSSTADISTAVINQGVGSVFTTNPTAPGTINGTTSVTTPANTNTTYTITVTTVDGKTSTSSTTTSWLPARYWGRTSNTTATSSDLLAAAGGNKGLSNSRAGTFTVTASGSNKIFFAYVSSAGDLTSINIGGLESIGAFTKTVISHTNVNGFTQNYNVYTSNNATSGNVTYTTQ